MYPWRVQTHWCRFRRLQWLLCGALVILSVPVLAQGDVQPPREFPEFRGTWIRDDTAGSGRIGGLTVARTLVIATTPTEISVAKDAGIPEIYRFDGTETQIRDPRTGAPLDRRYSFLLVADMLALTTRWTRPPSLGDIRNATTIEIITDACRVNGDVLTVERQLSVVRQPPGSIATMQNPGNNRQTIVYRRVPPG